MATHPPASAKPASATAEKHGAADKHDKHDKHGAHHGPAHHAPVTANAFGISVTLADHSIAEKPEMSKARKQAIWASVLIALTAIVLYFQYRPTADADPLAAQHPEIKQVDAALKKQDTGTLQQYAKSQDTVVAARAITALVNVNGADAARDYLNDSRSAVRYAAVASLGGTVNDMPVIQKFEQDPEPAIRVAAIRSLANIDDFEIFDHLMPMLNDPDPGVRRSAMQTIEARVGLLFPDFDAERPSPKVIARVRNQVSKMKQVFDQSVAFEKARRGRR
jgi:hypothetical protein